MKRLSALVLVLFSLQCLFASLYRSNAIGQMLEALEARPETGYLLQVEENVSTLYLDGKPLSRTTETKDGNDVLIIEEDLVDAGVSSRQYTDGLLVRESSPELSVSYGYIEGHLAFCSFFLPGEDEPYSTVFFLRSSQDGTLVAVKDADGYRFISGSYLVQSGSLLQMVSPNLVVQGDYSVNEDGLIEYEENGVTYLYNADGLLLETIEDGRSTAYSYVDGRLESTATVDGSTRIVETYVDGKLSETQVYVDDGLESRTEHREKGKVQTLYKVGRVVATVYYREDGRTVERIEYR